MCLEPWWPHATRCDNGGVPPGVSALVGMSWGLEGAAEWCLCWIVGTREKCPRCIGMFAAANALRARSAPTQTERAATQFSNAIEFLAYIPQVPECSSFGMHKLPSSARKQPLFVPSLSVTAKEVELCC